MASSGIYWAQPETWPEHMEQRRQTDTATHLSVVIEWGKNFCYSTWTKSRSCIVFAPVKLATMDFDCAPATCSLLIAAPSRDWWHFHWAQVAFTTPEDKLNVCVGICVLNWNLNRFTAKHSQIILCHVQQLMRYLKPISRHPSGFYFLR